MPNPYFQFKQFTINHDRCAMKVGTDGVLLGSWAGKYSDPKSILDIGTGTGLIALMLAQRFANADVHAVEIERDCAEQCQENFNDSPFTERLKCIHQSIQDFSNIHNSKYDLLVSNPPFFIDAFTSEDDQRNMARHNHSLRQHDLWKSVTELSHSNSMFCVILPVKEGQLFIEKGKEYPWFLQEKVNVKGSPSSSPKRVLLQFTRATSVAKESDIILEEQRGTYTSDFQEWVKDFYLNL